MCLQIKAEIGMKVPVFMGALNIEFLCLDNNNIQYMTI